MTKINVLSITITRGEGPLEGCRVPVDVPFEVDSWEKANEILRRIAADKRDDEDLLCYDKTDFKIEFEDGNTYEGRADVKADGDDTDLARHVREFLGYLGGYFRPSHVSDEDYARVMREYEREGLAANAREFLEKYEIPA